MVQSFIFCNHSRIFYYFWILIFFWYFELFGVIYWSPSINERQPLGRLEKLLLENLSEIIFLKNSKLIRFSIWLKIVQFTTRNTKSMQIYNPRIFILSSQSIFWHYWKAHSHRRLAHGNFSNIINLQKQIVYLIYSSINQWIKLF